MSLQTGKYKITSRSLKKTAQFVNNLPGVTVSLAKFSGQDNQTWIIREEDGDYAIRNAAYGNPAYAAIVDDISSRSRVKLGNEAYYWKIVETEGGYQILNTDGDLAWATVKTDELVHLTTLDTTVATSAQLWSLEPLS